MTFNCPKCGSDFIKGTKFCQTCGCNLELEFIENPTCPKCKTKYPTNTKFCVNDGSKLVRPEDLIPKCVICNTAYTEDIKFCPRDGGEVKIILTSHFQQPTHQKQKFATYDVNHKPNQTKMFKAPFSFDGRIRRTEFGISLIINAVASLFVQLIVVGMAQNSSNSYSSSDNSGAVIILFLIFLFPLLWFAWAQGAKRCHDLGNSGWWQLIPFYGFWLLFADGQYGANQYGDNPKGV